MMLILFLKLILDMNPVLPVPPSPDVVPECNKKQRLRRLLLHTISDKLVSKSKTRSGFLSFRPFSKQLCNTRVVIIKS